VRLISSTRTKKINFVETPARGRPWPENGPKRHRQIKRKTRKTKEEQNRATNKRVEELQTNKKGEKEGNKRRKTNEEEQ